MLYGSIQTPPHHSIAPLTPHLNLPHFADTTSIIILHSLSHHLFMTVTTSTTTTVTLPHSPVIHRHSSHYCRHYKLTFSLPRPFSPSSPPSYHHAIITIIFSCSHHTGPFTSSVTSSYAPSSLPLQTPHAILPSA